MSLKQIITSLMVPAFLGISAQEAGCAGSSVKNSVGSAAKRFWMPSWSATLVAPLVQLKGVNR